MSGESDLILESNYFELASLGEIISHIKQNISKGVSINNILVRYTNTDIYEHILFYAMSSRRLLLFTFLLENDCLPDKVHLKRTVLEYIFNNLMMCRCDTERQYYLKYFDVLVKYGADVNRKFYLPGRTITMKEYVLVRRLKDVIVIFNKYDRLGFPDFNFVIGHIVNCISDPSIRQITQKIMITVSDIKYIDYIYEMVHHSLNYYSLKYIEMIDNYYKNYKNKFIMTIQTNDALQYEKETSTICRCCNTNSTLHPYLIQLIYGYKKCRYCPHKTHKCEHISELCMSCIETYKYKQCPICNSESIYNTKMCFHLMELLPVLDVIAVNKTTCDSSTNYAVKGIFKKFMPHDAPSLVSHLNILIQSRPLSEIIQLIELESGV